VGGALDWRIAFAEVFANPEPENSGFDIVLANPPYVRADERPELLDYRAELRNSNIYETLYEKWDLYVAFLERGFQLLRQGGVLYYIISDAYTAAKYAKKSHEFFIKNAVIRRVDFVHDIQLFDAGVRNIMVCVQKREEPNHEPLRVYHRDEFGSTTVLPSAPQSEFGAVLFRPDGVAPMEAGEGFVPITEICYISWGLRPNSDDRYYRGLFGAKDVISEYKDSLHPKPYVENRDTVKWWICRIRYLEWGTKRAPGMFARPTFPELYDAPEKLMAAQVCGDTPRVVYDNRQLIHNHSMCCFVPWHSLKEVVNQSINKTAKYRWQSAKGDREEREKLSQKFNLKYVLAIMNSTFAKDWLAKRRRHKIQLYPDDWKQLPIPPLSLNEQAEFVNLVDAILVEFEQWGYPLPSMAARRVADLEAELDERVAELYADATSSVDNDSD
jgi:adenine-specific DNA-methyltransferase